MLENNITATAKGNISGLDSMQSFNGDPNYSDSGCSLNTAYQYICEETSDNLYEHERRFKDAAFVSAFSIYKVRVRWTSTDYDAASNAQYFKVAEKELV